MTTDRPRTYLSLPYAHRTPLPEGYDHDIRTPDALVEHVLREGTDPGDRVLDPFAGFGTTLVTAARLDRIPYGVEYEPDRVAYVRERLDALGTDDVLGEDAGNAFRTDADDGVGGDVDDALGTDAVGGAGVDDGGSPGGGTTLDAHVRQGDVRDLDPSWFPAIDCAFTSPPFTTHGLSLNPFRNYEGDGSYAGYLDDVETAFSRVADVLAHGGRLAIDVVNMRDGEHVTPLAFDIAERVSAVESLRFDGETVVTWTDDGESGEREGLYGYGFDHSYCLWFRKATSG